MRFALIFNPSAGSGKGARATAFAARKIESNQRAKKNIAAIYGIGSPGSITETVKAALAEPGGLDALWIIGGDGTLHRTLNELIRAGLLNPANPAGLKIAYTPVGTGNDLATELGLSADFEVKLDRLLNPAGLTERSVSLFETGGMFFTNYIGLGFEGCVVESVESIHSRIQSAGFGHFGGLKKPVFFMAALKLVFAGAGKTGVIVESAPLRGLNGRFLGLIISSLKKYGGGAVLDPQSDIGDNILSASALYSIGDYIMLHLTRFGIGKSPLSYRLTAGQAPETALKFRIRPASGADAVTGQIDGEGMKFPAGEIAIRHAGQIVFLT